MMFSSFTMSRFCLDLDPGPIDMKPPTYVLDDHQSILSMLMRQLRLAMKLQSHSNHRSWGTNRELAKRSIVCYLTRLFN